MQRNVGDVIWLADQNKERNKECEDFSKLPSSSQKKKDKHKQRLSSKIPSTILHRDVRHLVVLLPIKEQLERRLQID